MSEPAPRAIHVFLVAGEHSGDQLGFKLMQALRAETGGAVRFSGVGGEAMAGEGLQSLFPLSDVAVMGFVPVVKRLPTVLRRIRETADAAIAARPDVLVIIDSPDFTHRVARRVRKALPELPVVDYVSPSVWAWRPGRARTMRGYVDHVLALLPFEPTAHERLGGPACTYVGHPLIERLRELRPNGEERAAREASPPAVLILPGSRRLEIERLMDDFRETTARIATAVGPVDFVLPAVEHLADKIRAHLESWPVKPRLVFGEAAKLAAFRSARAALAASGTVTLELALAGVPMVVAYKVSKVEELLKYVIQVPSIVLPNLVLGENVIPEFLQHACTPDALTDALLPLVGGGPERAIQLAALDRLDGLMRLPEGDDPSRRAARIILATQTGAGRA
jgi:lipid-A-disaccharide synthase